MTGTEHEDTWEGYQEDEIRCFHGLGSQRNSMYGLLVGIQNGQISGKTSACVRLLSLALGEGQSGTQ